jgi:hypothetical protein
MVRWLVTTLRLGLRNWPQLLVFPGGFLVAWTLSGRSMFTQSNDPLQTLYGTVLTICFVTLFNMAYLLTRPMFRLGARLTPAPDLLHKWQPVATRLGLTLTEVFVADGSEFPGVALAGWKRLSLQASRELLSEMSESELETRAACCLSERIPAATTPLVSHLIRFSVAFVLLAVAWRFVPAYVLLLPAVVAAVAFYHGWIKKGTETIKVRSRALEGIGISPEDFAYVLSTAYQKVAQSGILGPFARATTAQVNAVVSSLGHPQHAVPAKSGPRIGRVVLAVVGVWFGLLVLSVIVALWLASPS